MSDDWMNATFDFTRRMTPRRTPPRGGRAVLGGLLAVLAVLAACPPPTNGETTATTTEGTTATTEESTTSSTQSTGEPTTGTTTATTEPGCVCHVDCPDTLYCYPNSQCGIDPTDCGGAIIEVPILAPDVVLVVDKSASMGAVLWDGDGDPNTPPVTRWRSLHGAVEGFVGAYERSMNLGAVLSPSLAATSEYTSAACLVAASPEVPVAPLNGAALLAALPAATAGAPILAGATPTRSALDIAIMHLHSLADELPRAIVLVTDGAANCSIEAVDEAERFEAYDASVVDVVADAAAVGITTFVLGLAVADEVSAAAVDGEPDATNLFDRLNELALAGGAPQDDPDQRFYGADGEPGIEAALATIAESMLSCVVGLGISPKDPELVADYITVRVGGVDYGAALNIDACAGADGWRYVDIQTLTIEVCGQACADFRAEGGLEANVECPPPPEPPQCPVSG